MTDTPGVSVFMTVINEGRHLAATLDAILDQDYEGPLDVAVACGPSTDGTREILDAYAADHPAVTVVDNPSGVTPAGLNAAIAVTTHEVLVRVDGHAVIPRDYVRTAVETLRRTGAVNVGGIMAAVGVTPVEKAIAAAMTSRLGVGDASFHVGGEEGPALSVYLGSFRREAIESVGGYDEEFVRAQDWELNLRLREAGGVVWFTPRMRVTYRPRRTFGELARQYRDYGRWRRAIVRSDPSTLSLRYLAPPLALVAVVLGLAGSLVAAGAAAFGAAQWWWTLLGLVPVAGYGFVVGVGGLIAGAGLPWRTRLLVPRAIATMHAAWGWGFLTSRAAAES